MEQWSESKVRAFKEAEARFTAAWQKLLDATRASAPRSESNKARREYLGARAALEEHGRLFVDSALARCLREDRKRSGLPERSYWNDDLDDDDDEDGIGAGSAYWRREREDADEAERAVESSMLLGERFDRIIVGSIEGAGTLLHGLLTVAGAIALLWALIWLVKILWYLS